MDSPDICDSRATSDSNDSGLARKFDSHEDASDLRDQVIVNLQKSNTPNVNVPERIIICLDVCKDEKNSVYRLSDGTAFTPIDMLKRVLDFFLHSKHAINKQTEFALLILRDKEACWAHNFTNNLKDILNAINYVSPEDSTCEYFEFKKIFEILSQTMEVPDYKTGEFIMAPPYVVRMIVLYGRSNCIPLIPMEEPYFSVLKKHVYFYTDILFAHEEDCSLYKCEEIFDALQDLDNGYSYVFEVSRNATKIHDCIAKLLAHPLQRPLQKNTDYTFLNHS